MPFPVEIIFRDIDRSEALAADIQHQAETLEELYDHIAHCRVVVESFLRRNQSGRIFRISIRLCVPMRELTAGGIPHDRHENEDPHIAMDDAFDAIRHQLKDYVDEQHGHTIPHLGTSHGQVAKIFRPEGTDYPERGYGFISTCDGREIYFHANSLMDMGFQRLELGSEVDFVEELGDHGPQAASVRLVGHEHYHLVE